MTFALGHELNNPFPFSNLLMIKRPLYTVKFMHRIRYVVNKDKINFSPIVFLRE